MHVRMCGCHAATCKRAGGRQSVAPGADVLGRPRCLPSNHREITEISHDCCGTKAKTIGRTAVVTLIWRVYKMDMQIWIRAALYAKRQQPLISMMHGWMISKGMQCSTFMEIGATFSIQCQFLNLRTNRQFSAKKEVERPRSSYGDSRASVAPTRGWLEGADVSNVLANCTTRSLLTL